MPAQGPDKAMRIRKMRESDVAPIVAFEKDIFPEPWSAVAFQDTLAYEDGGGIVAELETQDGSKSVAEIVGYACYYSAAGETHLTNIAVAKSYRRKGVAKRLLETIFAKARLARSEAVFLEVRASNQSAQQLYARFGFTELYRRKRYYGNPTEDAIVFVRELSE